MYIRNADELNGYELVPGILLSSLELLILTRV